MVGPHFDRTVSKLLLRRHAQVVKGRQTCIPEISEPIKCDFTFNYLIVDCSVCRNGSVVFKVSKWQELNTFNERFG